MRSPVVTGCPSDTGRACGRLVGFALRWEGKGSGGQEIHTVVKLNQRFNKAFFVHMQCLHLWNSEVLVVYIHKFFFYNSQEYHINQGGENAASLEVGGVHATSYSATVIKGKLMSTKIEKLNLVKKIGNHLWHAAQDIYVHISLIACNVQCTTTFSVLRGNPETNSTCIITTT